ncbi:hypothetical protein AAKU67_004457 [Oxalobacteraceae bacterium GrIS 2.11]
MHKSELKLVDSPNLLSKTDDGKTALHLAAALGTSKKYLVALVEAGLSVNERDQFGQTPLHIGAEYGTLETVRKLLKLGADPVAHDFSKRIPLECVNYDFAKPDLMNPYVSITGLNPEYDDMLTNSFQVMTPAQFSTWLHGQYEKFRVLRNARRPMGPHELHVNPKLPDVDLNYSGGNNLRVRRRVM